MDVVLASSNAGKIKELKDMLADLGVVIIPQQQLSIPDIEETGLCFVENAILKARNAALLSGKPAIADDSGLEVDLLDGQPGIYSARFSGEGATDSCNNQKLLKQLGCLSGTAHRALPVHYCLYAPCQRPDPDYLPGSWEGHIAPQPGAMAALVTTHCSISRISTATPPRWTKRKESYQSPRQSHRPAGGAASPADSGR